MNGKDRVCMELTGPDGVSYEPKHWAIFCPSCKQVHSFDGRWSFNGNQDKPTFKPSMLVNKDVTKADVREYELDGKTHRYERHRCHSFVTDGKIRFLNDCTHSMAGKTVELEPW